MIGEQNSRQFSSEMEVIKKQNSYFVAMGSCYKVNVTDPNESFAHLTIIEIDEQLTNPPTIRQKKLPPPNNENFEFIKGLEFSPDGSYLYLTYTGQTSLYYISVDDNTLHQFNNIPNPEKYKYSEIELGRDGECNSPRAEYNFALL